MCSPIGAELYLHAARECLPASGAQIVVSLPNLGPVVLKEIETLRLMCINCAWDFRCKDVGLTVQRAS